jgi:hypothetical protein
VSVDDFAHRNRCSERRPAYRRPRFTMKPTSTRKPTMAQTRPDAKAMTNAKLRRFQPARRNGSSRSARPQVHNSQNAEGKYQRYLALARAEALAGDRIAAENYFQHAEHYFRSMGNNKSLGSSEQPIS